MAHWTDRINPQVHMVWSGAWIAQVVEPPRLLIDHELVLVAKGRCVVDIAGRAYELGTGGFIIVPPATIHHTRVLTGGCTRHCLHFDWEWTVHPPAGPLFSFVSGRIPSESSRPAPSWVPSSVISGTARPTALTAGQRLSVHWRSGEHSGIRALALELLLALLVAPVPAVPPDRTTALARLVKDRLDRGNLDEVSIRKELRYLGQSYEHLCRAFTRTYGIPPLKYVLLGRVERAKVLLQEPGASVAGVAKALGYLDSGHFSRVFRSLTGCNPGKWPG